MKNVPVNINQFKLLTHMRCYGSTIFIISYESRLIFIPPLKHHWRTIHPPF